MSAAHEPLAFDELGWRQFLDLCAGVLEVDAGVGAGSWVGEEDRVAHLTRRHRPQGLSCSPMELVDRLTDQFLRVSETLKVDWVHPSWRDLVIDRLRQDAPARADFLERCTLEGVMLAISTHGGATGARSSTLLVNDHDWDLVTDQVMSAIREASDADVTRLLDALSAAVSVASRLAGAESWAEEPRSDDPVPESSPFTDATIRAHVERVLEDL